MKPFSDDNYMTYNRPRILGMGEGKQYTWLIGSTAIHLVNIKGAQESMWGLERKCSLENA